MAEERSRQEQERYDAHGDLWRAVARLEKEVKEIQRQMEDQEMQQAVQAGVRHAMRGKVLLPAGLFARIVGVLAAAVAIAGGIKGLIG